MLVTLRSQRVILYCERESLKKIISGSFYILFSSCLQLKSHLCKLIIRTIKIQKLHHSRKPKLHSLIDI